MTDTFKVVYPNQSDYPELTDTYEGLIYSDADPSQVDIYVAFRARPGSPTGVFERIADRMRDNARTFPKS